MHEEEYSNSVDEDYELVVLERNNAINEINILKIRIELLNLELKTLKEEHKENTIIQSMNDMKKEYCKIETKCESYEEIIRNYLSNIDVAYKLLQNYEDNLKTQIGVNTPSDLNLILKTQYSILRDIVNKSLVQSRKYMEIKYNIDLGSF